MSYENENLSVLAYANNFTLWHYTTPDIRETVMGEGYFNPATDYVCTNDLIIANINVDEKTETKFFIVQNKNDVVTISPYA